MENFKRGRDFAAWLGLVPRQHSSGGKERLGLVSKAGQADIRQLLIIGAPLMHVTIELDGSQDDPRGIVAVTNAGKDAPHADGDRAGQQDGARDLGHADEE